MHCDDFMIAAITRRTLVPGQPLIWPFSFWTLLLLMLPAEKQSFDSQKCCFSFLSLCLLFCTDSCTPFFSAQTAARTDGPRMTSTPCRQYLGLVKNRAAARNFTGARRLLTPKRLQKDYATPWVAEFTERFVALRRTLKLLPKNPCEMHTETPLKTPVWTGYCAQHSKSHIEAAGLTKNSRFKSPTPSGVERVCAAKRAASCARG